MANYYGSTRTNYVYEGYDEESCYHTVAIVDVDEIGNMHSTGITLTFSDGEMKELVTRDANLTNKQFRTVVNVLLDEALDFDVEKAEKMTDVLINIFELNGKPPIKMLKSCIDELIGWKNKEEKW